MLNLGDITEDTTIDIPFTTNSGLGGAIAPSSAFEAADIKIYKDGSAAEKTTTNGLTMTSPFDSITGLHQLTIDTGIDTGDSGFWEIGSDYKVVLDPDETVDGQTVVAVIAHFSIENRGGAIANAVWDESLTGASHNDPTSAGRRLRQLASNIYTDGTAQAGGINMITLAAGESSTDNIFRQSYVGIVGGTGAGQGHHILGYNGTSKVAVIDDDWVVPPDATSEYIIYGSGSHDENGEGLAQAGAASTVTLDPSASAIDDTYSKAWIVIVSGTGIGQARRVLDYNGTTKVATVSEAWTTEPDATSGYFIKANHEVEKAVWDEILTGGTHNKADSAGRRVRNLQEFGTYEGGAIFIDTVDGSSGTTDYENGTNINPVNNLADAITIAVSLDIKTFHIVTGSSITFAQTINDYWFEGHGWSLALGGQDVSGTHISGPASISGIGTGSDEIEFHNCSIGNVTLDKAHFETCGFSGTVTMTAAVDYEVENCRSTDNNTAIFDFGAAVASVDFNATSWKGKMELQNMGQTGTDVANIGGCGDITINANCVAGTVVICGDMTLTNNGSGQTILDDARLDITQIFDQVIAALSTDTVAELSAVPGETPTRDEMVQFLYQYFRNKRTATADEQVMFKGDTITPLGTATLSDDGTTLSKGEMG